jgi:predicted dehydrogenase
MSAVYRVGILGAGSIACGYDKPGDAAVLTHAHAVARHPRLSLCALYDVILKQAVAAGEKWGAPVVSDFASLQACAPDIVVVATPTETHAHYLSMLLAAPPRAVLCEKPLTKRALESEGLIGRYSAAGVGLAINFQRRFDPEVIELRSLIESGELGSPIAGAVWYSKGIMHNGSHAIDLLRFLFGEVQSLSVSRKVFDHGTDDPTVGGTVVFSEIAVALIASDERNFSLFEIDLLFSRGRYRFLQGGMILQRFTLGFDPIFSNDRNLVCVSERPSGLSNALLGRFDNLVDFLDGTSELRGTGADALQTQRLCERLAAAQPST